MAKLSPSLRRGRVAARPRWPPLPRQRLRRARDRRQAKGGGGIGSSDQKRAVTLAAARGRRRARIARRRETVCQVRLSWCGRELPLSDYVAQIKTSAIAAIIVVAPASRQTSTPLST